jgi:hypothetical protein
MNDALFKFQLLPKKPTNTDIKLVAELRLDEMHGDRAYFLVNTIAIGGTLVYFINIKY